ncbi:hypothetical protein AC1031_004545 [Aphanomyces cochlioides]|nr:hypothetical protein AC1031_004545 [Aphanomyces cochlioides]
MTHFQNYSSIEMNAFKFDILSSSGRTFYPNARPPTIKAKDSVIVQVKAAAINPVDYKIPKYMSSCMVALSAMISRGVVTQVSRDVKSVAVGDRVFGVASGSLAEVIECSARAALPIADVTSYQALSHYGFQAGMKVLVIGASGGCGSAGVQLAKAMGASQVVGVCSKKNEEFVKSLGADRIIDYETQSIDDGPAKYFDFVLDTATGSGHGEDYLDAAKSVLKDPSKHHVTLNMPSGLWVRTFLGFPRKDISFFFSSPNTAALIGVVKNLESSGSYPPIDSVFPFTKDGVDQAFAKLDSRRVKGKVVIEIIAN